MQARNKQTYARAGVNIGVANKIKKFIAQEAKTTFHPEVLNFGSFGSLFQLKGYEEPVLVSSVDGVGTKLKIASLLAKNDTVGIDLVNHCVNDILCCGASPLFFLDYIAMDKLHTEQVKSIVTGIVRACREVNCSLVGGEIAEMPGIYSPENYDLVGFVIGVVEKGEIIDGSSIVPGDVALGLPSSGLHTNGYSLVRRVFGIDDDPSHLHEFYPQLGKTLGEELLMPHRCYYRELKPVLSLIKGLAHITGGGYEGNIPRILPEGTGVHIGKNSWDMPPIFKLIQQRGNIDKGEMYRVFNMGMGMVVICSSQDAPKIIEALPQARVIGEIIKAEREKRIRID